MKVLWFCKTVRLRLFTNPFLLQKQIFPGWLWNREILNRAFYSGNERGFPLNTDLDCRTRHSGAQMLQAVVIHCLFDNGKTSTRIWKVSKTNFIQAAFGKCKRNRFSSHLNINKFAAWVFQPPCFDSQCAYRNSVNVLATSHTRHWGLLKLFGPSRKFQSPSQMVIFSSILYATYVRRLLCWSRSPKMGVHVVIFAAKNIFRWWECTL